MTCWPPCGDKVFSLSLQRHSGTSLWHSYKSQFSSKLPIRTTELLSLLIIEKFQNLNPYSPYFQISHFALLVPLWPAIHWLCSIVGWLHAFELVWREWKTEWVKGSTWEEMVEHRQGHVPVTHFYFAWRCNEIRIWSWGIDQSKFYHYT